MRPKQSGHYFADNFFNCILSNENNFDSNLIKVCLQESIDNKLALVQVMAAMMFIRDLFWDWDDMLSFSQTCHHWLHWNMLI